MANEKRLDLIDRGALLKRRYNSSPLKALQFAEMVVDVRDIEDAPTMDAVEVVHGRWVKTETNSTCSVCGANVISWSGEYDGYEKERGICLMHYCPNCGAKMDGDGNG